MKKFFILIACMSLLAVSCDALLDNTEGDLGKMSAEDMVSSEAGIQSLLAHLYSLIPIDPYSIADESTFYANDSRAEQRYSASVTGFWNYSGIREINKFIDAINTAAENGVVTEASRNAYIGEAMFIRAYCYFAAVRVYGGVPIVDRVLDNEYDGKENAGLYVPRSTEKETWDWILAQLDEAAGLLPEKHTTGDMRANKYTALALKARAALWAASVSKYWNQASVNPAYVAVQKKLTYMEASYADEYYKQCLDAAKAVIESGQYRLAGANPASVDEATNNLVNLFQAYDTTEGLFGISYKDGTSTTTTGVENWAPHSVTNVAMKHGEKSFTLNLVDEFDDYAADRSRVDGTVKTLVDGDETAYLNTPEETFTYADAAGYLRYDNPADPFKNKDARFQAWVVYPSCTFRGEEIKIQGGMITPDKQVVIYPIENTGVEFNGKMYYPYGGAATDDCNGFEMIATNLNMSNSSSYCFLVKKYVDPKGENPYTQSPWYDIRYSEVLLAYAEAAVESGLGDNTLAAKCLNDVRHRAGFTDNVALTLENVLHEYKVEFCYENKMQSVLYRRRAFYNESNPEVALEGTITKKLTLIPIVDLSGADAKYIFLRAPAYLNDIKRYTGIPTVNPDAYYKSIPNYVNNKIEDNNK